MRNAGRGRNGDSQLGMRRVETTSQLSGKGSFTKYFNDGCEWNQRKNELFHSINYFDTLFSLKHTPRSTAIQPFPKAGLARAPPALSPPRRSISPVRRGRAEDFLQLKLRPRADPLVLLPREKSKSRQPRKVLMLCKNCQNLRRGQDSVGFLTLRPSSRHAQMTDRESNFRKSGHQQRNSISSRDFSRDASQGKGMRVVRMQTEGIATMSVTQSAEHSYDQPVASKQTGMIRQDRRLRRDKLLRQLNQLQLLIERSQAIHQTFKQTRQQQRRPQDPLPRKREGSAGKDEFGFYNVDHEFRQIEQKVYKERPVAITQRNEGRAKPTNGQVHIDYKMRGSARLNRDEVLIDDYSQGIDNQIIISRGTKEYPSRHQLPSSSQSFGRGQNSDFKPLPQPGQGRPRPSTLGLSEHYAIEISDTTQPAPAPSLSPKFSFSKNVREADSPQSQSQDSWNKREFALKAERSCKSGPFVKSQALFKLQTLGEQLDRQLQRLGIGITSSSKYQPGPGHSHRQTDLELQSQQIDIPGQSRLAGRQSEAIARNRAKQNMISVALERQESRQTIQKLPMTDRSHFKQSELSTERNTTKPFQGGQRGAGGEDQLIDWPQPLQTFISSTRKGPQLNPSRIAQNRHTTLVQKVSRPAKSGLTPPPPDSNPSHRSLSELIVPAEQSSQASYLPPIEQHSAVNSLTQWRTARTNKYNSAPRDLPHVQPRNKHSFSRQLDEQPQDLFRSHEIAKPRNQFSADTGPKDTAEQVDSLRNNDIYHEQSNRKDVLLIKNVTVVQSKIENVTKVINRSEDVQVRQETSTVKQAKEGQRPDQRQIYQPRTIRPKHTAQQQAVAGVWEQAIQVKQIMPRAKQQVRSQRQQVAIQFQPQVEPSETVRQKKEPKRAVRQQLEITVKQNKERIGQKDKVAATQRPADPPSEPIEPASIIIAQTKRSQTSKVQPRKPLPSRNSKMQQLMRQLQQSTNLIYEGKAAEQPAVAPQQRQEGNPLQLLQNLQLDIDSFMESSQPSQPSTAQICSKQAKSVKQIPEGGKSSPLARPTVSLPLPIPRIRRQKPIPSNELSESKQPSISQEPVPMPTKPQPSPISTLSPIPTYTPIMVEPSSFVQQQPNHTLVPQCIPSFQFSPPPPAPQNPAKGDQTLAFQQPEDKFSKSRMSIQPDQFLEGSSKADFSQIGLNDSVDQGNMSAKQRRAEEIRRRAQARKRKQAEGSPINSLKNEQAGDSQTKSVLQRRREARLAQQAQVSNKAKSDAAPSAPAQPVPVPVQPAAPSAAAQPQITKISIQDSILIEDQTQAARQGRAKITPPEPGQQDVWQLQRRRPAGLRKSTKLNVAQPAAAQGSSIRSEKMLNSTQSLSLLTIRQSKQVDADSRSVGQRKGSNASQRLGHTQRERKVSFRQSRLLNSVNTSGVEQPPNEPQDEDERGQSRSSISTTDRKNKKRDTSRQRNTRLNEMRQRNMQVRASLQTGSSYLQAAKQQPEGFDQPQPAPERQMRLAPQIEVIEEVLSSPQHRMSVDSETDFRRIDFDDLLLGNSHGSNAMLSRLVVMLLNAVFETRASRIQAIRSSVLQILDLPDFSAHGSLPQLRLFVQQQQPWRQDMSVICDQVFGGIQWCSRFVQESLRLGLSVTDEDLVLWLFSGARLITEQLAVGMQDWGRRMLQRIQRFEGLHRRKQVRHSSRRVSRRTTRRVDSSVHYLRRLTGLPDWASLGIDISNTQFMQYLTLIQSNVKYIDTCFPLSDRSAGFRGSVWRRTGLQYPAQSLRIDCASRLEFKMGGGTAFASVLGWLCSQQQLLNQVFSRCCQFMDGLYSLNLMGVACQVDDFIPVEPDGSCRYVQPFEQDGVLVGWPLMLQKGFAKLVGGYSQLYAVSSVQAFMSSFSFPYLRALMIEQLTGQTPLLLLQGNSLVMASYSQRGYVSSVTKTKLDMQQFQCAFLIQLPPSDLNVLLEQTVEGQVRLSLRPSGAGRVVLKVEAQCATSEGSGQLMVFGCRGRDFDPKVGANLLNNTFFSKSFLCEGSGHYFLSVACTAKMVLRITARGLELAQDIPPPQMGMLCRSLLQRFAPNLTPISQRLSVRRLISQDLGLWIEQIQNTYTQDLQFGGAFDVLMGESVALLTPSKQQLSQKVAPGGSLVVGFGGGRAELQQLGRKVDLLRRMAAKVEMGAYLQPVRHSFELL